MNAFVQYLFKKIWGTQPAARPQDETVRWAEAGDSASLVEAARALLREGEEPNAAQKAAAGFMQIARTLALYPQPGFADAAVSLTLVPYLPGRYLCRDVAETLLSGQSVETLQALFSQYGMQEEYRETLACLLHEMILRGMNDSGTGALDDFGRQLRDVRHPLGWLPTRRLTIENGLAWYLGSTYLLGRPFTGCSFAGPREERQCERIMHRADRRPLELPQSRLHDITTPEWSLALTLAVANWQGHSHDGIETHVFEVDSALSPAEITPELIVSLELECVGNARAEQIELFRVDTGRVLDILFSVSSSGGAYCSGRRGAYGRLEAWKNLGALAGIVAEVSIEAVLERAAQCHWFTFDAKSGWFAHFGWDVGIACLQPGGRFVSILAATDTD